MQGYGLTLNIWKKANKTGLWICMISCFLFCFCFCFFFALYLLPMLFMILIYYTKLSCNIYVYITYIKSYNYSYYTLTTGENINRHYACCSIHFNVSVYLNKILLKLMHLHNLVGIDLFWNYSSCSQINSFLHLFF